MLYRFLATGESYRSLAFQFRITKSTVSYIVSQCLTAIIAKFLESQMPKPTSEHFKKIIAEFFLKWNYPNCGGAIDGQHVRVQCPANAGSSFFNYKDFHSVVLLAIVDANYKFIAADIGSYGREGDAGRKCLSCTIESQADILIRWFSRIHFLGIYLKSEMGKMIESDNFNLPPPAALPHTNVIVPHFMIGDEAFALTKNMMKPYPRQQSLLDPSKAIYNYRHSRARRTTENAFGIMSSYFRIFFTPINVKPETIDKIIT